MATIRTAVQLYDGMTGPIKSIVKAMGTCISSFEAMQTASDHAVDTGSLIQARAELTKVAGQIEEIENNINHSAQAQRRVTNEMDNSSAAADGLWSKVKGIAASIGGIMALQKVLGLSDQMAGTEARLSLIVDDGGSVKALEKKIMASAQRSRSAYLDAADAVAKLGLMAGDAFKNNDEMIRFTELMNKNFVIAGAAAQEQSSAMYQLNQAMGSGRLQGDEYKAIIENAPLLAKSIESYMRNAGVEGTMKEWSADGLLTADVIKNALFSSADEVEARFEQMPMTWGQVWNRFSNIALMAFQPVLSGINWLANNIAIIGPMVLGLGTAFLVFQVAAHWTQIAAAAMAAYHAVQTLLSIGFGVLTGNAAAASAAVFTFNSALLASPITWIIIIMAILIGALYAGVAVFNKLTGSAVSATGIICGAVMFAVAFIGNLVIGLLNALIQSVWSIFVEPFIGIIEWVLNATNGGFNSFGGAVANLIGQIISWFLSLGKVVTKIIDAIFGTNWTAGLSSLQDSVLAWGKNEESITISRDAPTIDHRFEYGAAWDMGYNFGQGIEDRVSGMFNFDDADGGAGTWDDMYGKVDDIAGNTAVAADAFDIAGEDLSYLRDIAGRQAINRFTTRDITITQNNENHIGSDMDLDGVLDRFSNDLTEELDVSGEGVHD